MSAQKIRSLRLPFSLSLAMPGSKSHANRAIIAACLAEGQMTILEHVTPCDDVRLMVENLVEMGFQLKWIDESDGKLEILGGIPRNPDASATLDCDNAGTTLRFLTSLAALVPGKWEVTGDERMRSRPMGDLVSALRQLGAEISDTYGCPPIRVRGGRLKGGEVVLDTGKSSQFLSSLLLVGPVLERGLSVRLSSGLASPGYVELTRKVMKDFGSLPVPSQKNVGQKRFCPTFFWEGTGYQSPRSYAIEGDWSAAGAWLVLAELTRSSVAFTNLSSASLQSDRALPRVIQSLRGKGDRSVDCSDTPDQVMNIAVLAAFREGKTTITGATNLRWKECDRLQVITQELKKAGVIISEIADGLLIEGAFPSALPDPVGAKYFAPTGSEARGKLILDPHDDHRMAMCFAVLGAIRPGIAINDPDCVSKSYPNFFADLARIYASPKPVAIVGMRGIGKSSLGRKLASKLKLQFTDTDKEFERLRGKVQSVVTKEGWSSFRRDEEKIVAESLVPGRVVALGGGAIESKFTRDVLRRRAIVVWMRASKRVIIERLKRTKRPPLTKLPMHEEVAMLLRKRDPLYAEVATLNVSDRMPFSRQIPFVMKQLANLARPFDL